MQTIFSGVPLLQRIVTLFDTLLISDAKEGACVRLPGATLATIASESAILELPGLGVLTTTRGSDHLLAAHEGRPTRHGRVARTHERTFVGAANGRSDGARSRNYLFRFAGAAVTFSPFDEGVGDAELTSWADMLDVAWS